MIKGVALMEYANYIKIVDDLIKQYPIAGGIFIVLLLSILFILCVKAGESIGTFIYYIMH